MFQCIYAHACSSVLDCFHFDEELLAAGGYVPMYLRACLFVCLDCFHFDEELLAAGGYVPMYFTRMPVRLF